MKWLLITTLALMFSVTANPSTAQIRQDAELTRGPLINDVEESRRVFHPATVALRPSSAILVDVDLAQVDVAAAIGWFVDQSMVSVREGKELTQMLDGIIKPLRSVSVGHVYAIIGTSTLVDGGPVIVIPCDNPLAVEGLASVVMQLLPGALSLSTRKHEDLVLIGPAVSLDRIDRYQGDKQTRLVSLALSSSGKESLDHKAVFELPTEARRELLAYWPETAPSSSPVEFSPKQLLEDLVHVTVSWDMPPLPQVQVTIFNRSRDAASRTKEIVDQWIAQREDLAARLEVTKDGFAVKVTASTDAIEAAVGPAQRASVRRQEIERLSELGKALHAYHEYHGHFPPRCFVDRDGRELLSLRVCILPHLEQLAMYGQFRLGQPWDSKHNFELAKIIIPTYRVDSRHQEGAAKTTVRFPVFPGSLWDGDGPPRTVKDVTDGTSNTIAAIIAPADEATPWSSPRRWDLFGDDLAEAVFGDRDEIVTLFLDGSVRVFKKDELDSETLKKYLTIAGREVVQP
ncbi:DUF1559 family PulG-like putative transporter [Novipirellula artificiosorum]|uniref:DUF1559 domain-containing protein n=1 Tax=Novipirellula artificiosorum TaxID=2528016 RepID=A0A5C6D826_9BACT|nr:DUF1559 domain-containing protein [Novipirellula artificiosorum]TWU32918.1 hypothetical protein Poly41_52960 [Novipirellula artificiosorum]